MYEENVLNTFCKHYVAAENILNVRNNRLGEICPFVCGMSNTLFTQFKWERGEYVF